MEDHETIQSYVEKLQSIANSLAEINNPVSDQDLVLQLLTGLPSQYLLLKNTISSRFPLPKFSDACSMLYEYEKSLTPPPPPPPNHSVRNIRMSSPKKENDEIKQTQLKIQFHSTKKEDHENIESYVEKLQSIANSLAEINNPISDQDLVLQLLAGLPSQYLLLKNTLLSMCPLPNFEQACNMAYMQQGILLQDPHDVGAEQSSAIREVLDVVGTVVTVVGTVGTVVGTVGAFPTVAGAVAAVGAVRIIGIGVMDAVAGWKIRQANPSRGKK